LRATIVFDEARRVIDGAVASATARGNRIAVAVLDAAGDPVMAARMDGVMVGEALTR
jgi:uncharacterized protein GlcG (DUF336 family)